MKQDLWRAIPFAAVLLCVQACDEPPIVHKPDMQPLVQQWMGAMSQNHSDFGPVELPDWPEGLFMHQQAQAESFQVQAVLTPTDVTSQHEYSDRVGLIAQIDRLAIRPVVASNAEQSGWQYSGIVRSSVFVDSAAAGSNVGKADSANALVSGKLATIERDQMIQRMALGLGGATEQALWVGNDKVEVTLIDNASAICQRQYHWSTNLSANDSVELYLSANHCPQAQSAGSLITWQQNTSQVTASLVSKDGQGKIHSVPMQGIAWLRQSWGNLPAAGGAVVIDTLQIRLEDQRWLDVSRSKRRSGRGPKTVFATLASDELSATQVSVEWEDSDEQRLADSGTAYPQSIRVVSHDKGIDLHVSALNRLSESLDPSGHSLHVPVVVSGSHEGAGFLSFYALPVDSL